MKIYIVQFCFLHSCKITTMVFSCNSIYKKNIIHLCIFWQFLGTMQNCLFCGIDSLWPLHCFCVFQILLHCLILLQMQWKTGGSWFTGRIICYITKWKILWIREQSFALLLHMSLDIRQVIATPFNLLYHHLYHSIMKYNVHNKIVSSRGVLKLVFSE